eukprot:TRINITY_DN11892_c0_g6_i1.p2 TRINITY_DN11892_c0_g6~~TRINITY_DN11892_c0_g6_i1.p2  ORF type:complete len:160 (+),score=36.19 TRINITY_DN11892_c0_g6_i1:1053-1532(+)
MGDSFGYSTVAADNMIICSAPRHDPSTTNFDAGSIFVYTRNSTGFWNFHQRINDNHQRESDILGYSMDINMAGDTLIVFAHNDDDAADGAGALYLFTKDVNSIFSQTNTVFHSDAGIDDEFGMGVSFGDGFIVAGAWHAEDAGQEVDHGKAYVFVPQND